MPLTNPSPGTSSGRTTVSGVIARRARHEASLKRQVLRQIDKKAGERVWVDDYPRAHSARTKSTRSITAAAEPDASPFRRSLEYLCDNFLPTFLTPKKKRGALGTFAKKRGAPAPLILQDNTSPQVSAETSEDIYARPSSSEKLAHHLLTAENLLKHNNGTSDDYKGDATDEDIGSSLFSTGTPTPVGHHNQADGAIAVEDDEDHRDTPERRKYLQKVYEKVTQWQANADFEPPLEQVELPNPFFESEIEWSSKKEAKKDILYARLHADTKLYGLLCSGTLVRSCADTFSQLDDYLYVEYLEEKFREKYGGDLARRLSRLHSSSFAEDPAVDLEQFLGYDHFRIRLAGYERAWAAIKERRDERFTFKTIPWPLFNEPKSFEDITAIRVQDFFRFAKIRHGLDFLCESPVVLRQAAEFELNRTWRAKVFMSLITGRIVDPSETAMILHCSGIVAGALQQLASL